MEHIWNIWNRMRSFRLEEYFDKFSNDAECTHKNNFSQFFSSLMCFFENYIIIMEGALDLCWQCQR